MKRDRALVYKAFYTNRFTANKAVAVMYLHDALDDFFAKYPFNSKDIKDYDHNQMSKHIVFDLCRILGDAGYRLYELLTDYIDDLYNRNEIEMCARAISETIKLADVN
ncbi:hypothetical protein [uncultured phage cr25_1]|jgi:hypothetical protein|uniref:Uncharacterized protein n=1 Tax=uncultured phage cr25_1 TaxID=2986395 RepID=A0AAE7RVR2_9CAUD|nr:hypothetical protein M1M55_gp64 [uncultured phage cr25_1]QWM90271.1 hypothetical protein [uncultured phage cr25_1]